MGAFGDFENVAGMGLALQFGPHGVKNATCTYTTRGGTATEEVPVKFRFLVGAADDIEQAVVAIQTSDVASPAESDRILLTGEAAALTWQVQDIRPRANYNELRIWRKKASP